MSFNPWLVLPAPLAHDLAPLGLKCLTSLSPSIKTATVDPLQWRGLYFRNRMGVAGGVDKEARQILSWQHLGCGFVEVGTVTPKPQGPNPGVILARDRQQNLLWNKMGFPNPGAETVGRRLARLREKDKIQIPVFINVGKNRSTELDQAAVDYLSAMTSLHSVADGFVINISSPNTQGLRQLQSQNFLHQLLSGCLDLYRKNFGEEAKPVWLKLSPDSEKDDFLSSLATAAQHNIDGIVLTNTTRRRPTQDHFPEDGGFSGAAVADLSRQALEIAAQFRSQNHLRWLLVSTGGIMDVAEIQRRRALGADLVQAYSALVLKGPFFFSRCLAQSMTSSQV